MMERRAVAGDVGTVESMLDVLAGEGVVALLQSVRDALADWRAARKLEATPSHRTLVLRDDLAHYFGLGGLARGMDEGESDVHEF